MLSLLPTSRYPHTILSVTNSSPTLYYRRSVSDFYNKHGRFSLLLFREMKLGISDVGIISFKTPFPQKQYLAVRFIEPIDTIGKDMPFY